jgi:hypothetical protein
MSLKTEKNRSQQLKGLKSISTIDQMTDSLKEEDLEVHQIIDEKKEMEAVILLLKQKFGLSPDENLDIVTEEVARIRFN